MANGERGGGSSAASRTRSAPTRRRRLLALAVSIVATAAVTIPLAYQAHAARPPLQPIRRGAVVVPSTVPPHRNPPVEVLPTTTFNPTPQLRWMRSGGGEDPAVLDGATVSDLVLLWVDVDVAQRVEFWVDPGPRIRRPVMVDDVAPFTLRNGSGGGSEAFDTRRLTNGAHA
ncbi:MAG: hypothetical protein JST64_06200, partial [Actinobacteria bacterium]|nr:hypothetical protein [Actinomycetota bacterium]